MQFTLQGFPSGPSTIPEGNLLVLGASNVVAIEIGPVRDFRGVKKRVKIGFEFGRFDSVTFSLDE